MDHADHARWLSRAQSLAEAIQQGNDDEVHRILDEISSVREHMLFQELGRLTREFHEELNSFRLDARVTRFARENIPDAKQRLNYVIVMTEQAATRTLNAVEGSIPLCEKISDQVQSLHEKWLRFTQRTLTAADFRKLSHELTSFFESVSADTNVLRENLSEVLMAQDYQDITGQILQRVVRLVNEMEEQLVRLVRGNSSHLSPEAKPLTQEKSRTESGEVVAAGPYVPGVVPGEEVVHSQDDVDDLLSSLGF